MLRCACGVLVECGYGILFPGFRWLSSEARPGQKRGIEQRGRSVQAQGEIHSVKDRYLADGIQIYGVHVSASRGLLQ